MQKKWWHNKVAYQIYPKSFLDTTGSGTGDLQGIIQKLDYLKDLGVDIIWICPCYQSPFADQGYDISDYYKIDPLFGSMEDLDTLIAEAKKRDMYVLMDLVVNHCSDEHEWFQKALADPEGEYGSYFYIEKGINGQPPNNWRSYFGGSVWEPIPGTDKYYFHAFHKKQPDLNWENPALRQKIYEMIRWWLAKGLAGFRIDAIINIKKALPFSDYNYPPDREDGLCAITRMLSDAVGIGTFLGEMRDLAFAPFDAFTVGEVFDMKAEDLASFIGENGYFSTMFDFRETVFGAHPKGWYASTHITPEDYKQCLFTSQQSAGNIGFLSNIIENHDEPRGVSRYIPAEELCEDAKKALATVYFFLKGLPWIYQGQELGMENLPFTSIEEINDINTLDEYQVAIDAGLSPADALRSVSYYSRDNARTPFQWDASANAGFTTGTPWLRINPNYTQLNASDQLADEASMLSYYKKLIALRKDPAYCDTFVYGDFIPYLPSEKNLIAYIRKSDSRTLLILVNYQKEARTISIPASYKKIILNNKESADIKPSCTLEACSVSENNALVTLQGYQALVLA